MFAHGEALTFTLQILPYVATSSSALPFGVYSLQQLGNNLVPHVPVSTDASSHGGRGVNELVVSTL